MRHERKGGLRSKGPSTRAPIRHRSEDSLAMERLAMNDMRTRDPASPVAPLTGQPMGAPEPLPRHRSKHRGCDHPRHEAGMLSRTGTGQAS
jgi:hypothetical protein